MLLQVTFNEINIYVYSIKKTKCLMRLISMFNLCFLKYLYRKSGLYIVNHIQQGIIGFKLRDTTLGRFLLEAANLD